MSQSIGQRYRQTISLEGLVDGKAHREFEYTFYVKLTDMAQLKDAFLIETHEQWKIPIDTEAHVRTRIRLTDNRRATMTTKLYKDGVLGAIEVDCDISMDLFSHLRLCGRDGYKKIRHCFKIPNSERIWEIDVFLTPTGAYHPWVKVDYEVDPEHKDAIPDLPVDFDDAFLDGGPKQTMEQKRFVRKLWREEWLRLDDGYAPIASSRPADPSITA